MVEFESDTEKKVYEAAKTVFSKKGLEGARMQEIADEAGINKSLLHYYFRSKDKLFNIVFEDIVAGMLNSLFSSFEDKGTLEEKLYKFVELYISFLQKNPHVISFMLNTGMHQPKLIGKIFGQLKLNPKNFFLKTIQEEMDKGNIIKMQPEHLLMNIISMCVFPFIAKPILTQILEIESDKKFKEMMNERKEIIPKFVLDAILIKKN